MSSLETNYTIDEINAAIARKGELQVGKGSVLENKPAQDLGRDVLDYLETAAKGAFSGAVLGPLGGWGNVYEAVTGKKSPVSTGGLAESIQRTTGVNVNQVPSGYAAKPLFEFSQQAAPAGAFTLMGVPGIFSNTARGAAAEAALAGTAGNVAATLSPENPLGQALITSVPNLAVGGYRKLQERGVRPEGVPMVGTQELLNVGPLTPGEVTGSRVQLANEAKTELNPSIEQKGNVFRNLQTTSVSKFLDNLFSSASSNALTADEVTNKVSTSFTNYGKALAGKLKSQAASDFNAAEKAGGMVDTGPVVDRLKQLQGSLRPDLNPSDAVFSTKIQTILDSLVRPEVPEVRTPSRIVSEGGAPAFESVTPGTPAGTNKISIGDLKRALSGWGDAAWSGNYALNGSNVFEGLAPGQAKGVARTVLNGFRDALNNAIDTNVPGADLLKDARTNFSKNLDKIDEFADMPVVKAFGKPANQLVPEEVLNTLKNQAPSQRALTIGILGSNAPAVLDSVRAAKFNDILQTATIPNAATGAPSLDFKKLLSAINNKDELGFLFQSGADRTQADLAVKYLQRVLQTSQGEVSGGLKGGDIYSGTRALGGGAQEANALKELYNAVRGLIATPNAMADVVFNKDTVKSMLEAQKKSTPTKILEAAGNISKSTAQAALRFGPRAANAPEVQVGEPQMQDTSGVSLQDIEEAIRRKQGQ